MSALWNYKFPLLSYRFNKEENSMGANYCTCGHRSCPHCGGSTGSIKFGYPNDTTWVIDTTTEEKKPFKCPVCKGAGEVDESLYHEVLIEERTGKVFCRTCKGKGIV